MIIAYERRDESSEYVDNSGFNSYVFRSTNEIRFKYLKEGKTEMRERQMHTIITHRNFKICHFHLNQISWRQLTFMFLCKL